MEGGVHENLYIAHSSVSRGAGMSRSESQDFRAKISQSVGGLGDGTDLLSAQWRPRSFAGRGGGGGGGTGGGRRGGWGGRGGGVNYHRGWGTGDMSPVT